jgi:hypothetical protein
VKTFDVIQRSESWHEVRKGIPTASRFDMILTAVQAKPAAAQETLINQLLAESIMPPQQGLIKNVMTEEMETGMILEAEARCRYELEFADLPVTEVGFIMADNGLYGGSPDALVGDVGGVEIKCPSPSVQIGYIRSGTLPNEYRCQVHGYLAITGRAWWDFFAYARNLPVFKIRVYRDDFTLKLESELLNFASKYQKAREAFGIMDVKAAKEAELARES